MQKETGLLERVFHLSENGTSVKTEIMAGITTFMTMAYILAVNPAIMSAAGMDKGAVLTATAIAGFLGTVLMAAFANYPFALAPGMGLNAFFAFTVVKQMGYTWEMALAAVFVEGVIFIVLSLTNVREAIFNAIPLNLKKAVSAGIGLFICFIGLTGAQIIVGNPATKISLFSFKQAMLTGTFHTTGITVVLAILGVLFTAFLFVDVFDTLGTLIGVAAKANMLDNEGRLPRIKGALMADAVATTAGAVLGVSTTTTYVESAAGVSEGGRTGLTAMTVAVLFILSLFLSPFFMAIPAFATAPALITVGFLMFTAVAGIDFTDMTEAIPCYLAIIAMPFAYSIAEGISFGVISYVIINALAGKTEKISPLMYILTVLFILKYILL